MGFVRGFLAAFVLTGLLAGCDGGGTAALPEEQKKPEAGVDAREKLKAMAPPSAPKKKR